MFTSVEESYLKGLINNYFKQGYKYYVCHTVTETDNDYDVYLYLSKEEIIAITSTSFDITHGVFIMLDSSSRNDNTYNPSTGYRLIVSNSDYTDILSVNKAEFIYSNAEVDYDVTTLSAPADILINNSDTLNGLHLNILCCFILTITFLYTFLSNILRLKRR